MTVNNLCAGGRKTPIQAPDVAGSESGVGGPLRHALQKSCCWIFVNRGLKSEL